MRNLSRRLAAAAVVLTLAVVAPISALAASANLATITPGALKAALDQGKAILVLDVRPADEITALGKIPGAVVVSTDKVMTDTSYLPDNKGAEIVVYSTGNETASMVVLALVQLLGYTNVKVLDGGFTAWDFNGYPYEEWEAPTAAPIPGGC